nr:calmodulin-like protein 9 [Ipomoea batatas]
MSAITFPILATELAAPKRLTMAVPGSAISKRSEKLSRTTKERNGGAGDDVGRSFGRFGSYECSSGISTTCRYRRNEATEEKGTKIKRSGQLPNSRSITNYLLCLNCGKQIKSSITGGRSIPQFRGSGYETWRKTMKAFLKSCDLWDFVEKGYKAMVFVKHRKKKETWAMVIMVLALDDSVDRCIFNNANTSKQLWDGLQNKYQ